MCRYVDTHTSGILIMPILIFFNCNVDNNAYFSTPNDRLLPPKENEWHGSNLGKPPSSLPSPSLLRETGSGLTISHDFTAPGVSTSTYTTDDGHSSNSSDVHFHPDDFLMLDLKKLMWSLHKITCYISWGSFPLSTDT